MKTRRKTMIGAAIVIFVGLGIVVLQATRPDAPRDEPDGDDRTASSSERDDTSQSADGESPAHSDPGESEDATDPTTPEPDRRGPPPTKGDWSTDVEVVDVEGQPVRGATIDLSTDPATGKRRITVTAPGFVEAVVVMRPGESTRIQLERALEIAGTVIDESTREVVAGVVLTAREVGVPRNGPSVRARSRPDGGFTFVVPAGRYVIRIGTRAKMRSDAAVDFLPATTDPVEAGSDGVVIALTRGLTISGQVEMINAEGSILDQISIEVKGLLANGKLDTTRNWHAYASRDGSFRIGGLPAGSYRLRFLPMTSGDLLAPTVLPSVAAGTEGVVVHMQRGQSISGRVEDENGEPVTTAGFIYVFSTGTLPGQGGTVAVKSGPGGKFGTVPLELGTTYEILATGYPGFAAAKLEGVVPGSEDVVIVLARALRITGRVLDANGKPAPRGVGIMAIAVGENASGPRGRATAYTDAGGNFALEGLGDFEYRVRAGGGQSAFRAGEAVDGVRPGSEPIELRVTKGVRFAGRLVDEAGRPVKTNIVRGRQKDEAVAPWAGVEDDEGRFVLTGLAPGKVELSAYLDGTYVALGEFDAPATDVVVTVPSR